jgi:aspartyl-tRNA(Asn)/glutamyl-tRNA(Gln) amidotransferase subunit C
VQRPLIASNTVSTTLTIEDVERIARLANLELTRDEKTLFTKQLADILAYAEQVQGVDTTGVEGTAHVNANGVERPDEPKPSLEVSEAIANAPDAAPEAGLFRVPRVIG